MPPKPPSVIPLVDRDIVFSALDISSSPHPTGSYVKLFQAARKQRIAVKIYGYEYGEISALKYVKTGKKVKWITGHIWRFVHIDKSLPWFNRETGEEVAKSEKEKISIPDGWAPNTSQIFWAFDVKNHILVFTRKNASYNLSPLQAERFFSTLLNEACKIVAGVDFVEVNTVKSSDKIAEIFSKRVAKLEIQLSRPNSDGDTGDAYDKILKVLKATNVKKKTEIFTSIPGKSIKPDDRMQTEIDATLRSGRIKATVFDDEGKKDEIDTKNHPLETKILFEPARKIAFLKFVAEAAVEIVLSIIQKKS